MDMGLVVAIFFATIAVVLFLVALFPHGVLLAIIALAVVIVILAIVAIIEQH